MAVHEVAEEGFGREAEVYERVRPSYPADAVTWLVDNLGLGPGRIVLDLAAGTGKFTRLLAPSGAMALMTRPLIVAPCPRPVTRESHPATRPPAIAMLVRRDRRLMRARTSTHRPGTECAAPNARARRDGG